MIIKKLDLQGFKSFAERTRLLFHPGITAIIGPNGTGKSNIVDAMLWVLRGSRLKAMRGDRSGDVIFNGNAKKPPLSMGDVILVLGDERKPDEEDLVISHRVYRSGENEYRLNGKTVRLMDIQDTLWKNAIGETEYFVIEQGSVGTFLTSKPVEKRLLLEEAAGTAFYKDKRRQAENKLANSEQNLIRLEDIIIEVEKSVSSLRRQAHAAVRYRKLRESIRQTALGLYRGRIDEMEKNQTVVSARYRENLERENNLISRLRIEEKTLAGLRKEIWSQEEDLKQRQENLYTLKSRHSRLEAEQEREEKRVDFFQDKLASADKSHKELAEEAASLERDRDETRRGVEANRAALAKKEKVLADIERAGESSRSRIEEGQKSLQEIRSAYLRKLSEQTEIKNQTTRQETEIELILRQIDKTGEDLEREQKRSGEIAARNEDIQSAQDLLKQKQKKLDSALKKDRKARTEHDANLDKLAKRRADLENRRSEMRHHLSALEKLMERERPSEEGERLPGALGFFADRIDSNPDHAPLVDVFYKEETRATLIHARELLGAAGGKRLKGRYLLLRPPSQRSPAPEVYSDSRVLGMLKSQLRADPQLKHHLGPLRDAAIVKDLAGAIELWLKKPDCNFITLDGDVLLSTGMLLPGQKKEGLITLKQEIRALNNRLDSLEGDLTPVVGEIERLIPERERLEKNIQSTTAELTELEGQLAEGNRELEFSRSEAQRVQARITLLDQEKKNLSRDRVSANERLAAQTGRYEKLEKEKAAMQRSVASAEQALEKLRRAGEQDRRRFFELRSEIGVFREKMNGLMRQGAQIDKRRNAVEQHLTALEHESRTCREDREKLEVRIEEIKVEIRSLSREIHERQEDLDRRQADLRGRQTRQEEIETALERIRGELETAKDERMKWEVRKAERERDLVNLEESCWQELKKNLDEVKREVSAPEFQIEEVERRLEKEKEQLQRFKAVNLMAEDEYQAQKERYDFLMKEKADLVESIASTREAIRKIDQESKQQFLKALEAVNRNFQDIFAILFKGGTARIKLSDENQPLESGIDIIAQPPGKKVQSISLLSGGEKSLTSLAFFFALFRYKPAPFCILDEVDAALDEANLTRFLTLMKTIKHQTQFIIITHNFKTMEVADYIYGTTMAEPNITSVYSVKMEAGGLRRLAVEENPTETLEK